MTLGGKESQGSFSNKRMIHKKLKTKSNKILKYYFIAIIAFHKEENTFCS